MFGFGGLAALASASTEVAVTLAWGTTGCGDHRRQKIQYKTYYQYPNRKTGYPFQSVLQENYKFAGFYADEAHRLWLGRCPTLGERSALYRKILLVTPDLSSRWRKPS